MPSDPGTGEDRILRDTDVEGDTSGPVVNLRRPNGSVIGVSRDEAQHLLQLEGYSVEGESAGRARRGEEATREYFTSTGERILTGVEGAARGLSLGLTSGLETERSAQRAQYNPRIALGSEIAGAVAPILLSGGIGAAASGGRLAGAVRGAAAVTPAGLVGRAGTATARALGGGIRGAAAGAAVEGALAAGVGSVARGDAEVVENVLAGAGLGALLGAGAGVIGRGVGKLAGSRAAREAAETAAAAERTTAAKVADSIEELRVAGDDLRTAMTAARRTAAPTAQEATALAAQLRTYGEDVLTAARRRPGTASRLVDASGAPVGSTADDVAAIAEARKALHRSTRALGRANSAARVAAAAPAVLDDAARLGRLIGHTGPAEELVGAVQGLTGRVGAGADSGVRRVSEVLQGKPVEWLARPAVHDAVEAAARAPGGAPVKDAVDRMARALGLEPAGSVRDTLTAAAAAAKNLPKGEAAVLGRSGGVHREKEHLVKRLVKGGVRNAAAGLVQQVAGGGIPGVLARQAAYGVAGYALAGESGAVLAGTLAGMRSGVSQRLAAMVERLGPGMSRGLRSSASPLGLSLTGNWDEDAPRASRAELFKRRANEITGTAPVARDLLYQSSIAADSAAPGLAAGLVEKGGAMLDSLLSNLPRDPGSEVMFFESDWEPSPQQLDAIEDFYQVVSDPLGALERGIEEGATREMARALNEHWPGLVAQMRLMFLDRAPELAKTMDLESRSALSVLLDYPIDPLCSPQGVAFFQAQFTPNEAPPSANQPGPQAGRPAGPGKPVTPTAAQAATDR